MKPFLCSLFLLFTLGQGLLAQESKPVTAGPEQMPYFPGCEKYKDGSPEKRNCSNIGVISFISNFLEYPEEAKEEQIEGTVMVSFWLKADGTLKQARVLNEIGGGCELAALDVLSKMPRWQPAMQKGKPVDVQLRLPVYFSLAKTEDAPNETYKIRWGKIKGNIVSKKELVANLEQTIQVWDSFGNVVPHSELMFMYEKGKGIREASSNGKLSKRQKRMVKFLRKGGDFIIAATLSVKGEFVYVEQVYEVR